MHIFIEYWHLQAQNEWDGTSRTIVSSTIATSLSCVLLFNNSYPIIVLHINSIFLYKIILSNGLIDSPEPQTTMVFTIFFPSLLIFFTFFFFWDLNIGKQIERRMNSHPRAKVSKAEVHIHYAPTPPNSVFRVRIPRNLSTKFGFSWANFGIFPKSKSPHTTPYKQLRIYIMYI
jgi:hypothetical protein